MNLTKWQKAKLLTAIPFFLFVPASLLFPNWILGFIFSFCAYYIIWLAATAFIEKRKNNPAWSKNLIFNSFGIIIIQVAITFIIAIYIEHFVDHSPPKMKLKKLEVEEK